MARDNAITGEDVQEALDAEDKLVTISSSTNEHSNATIDLSCSLDEITHRIARQVLENCGGNHTKASQSLKISRATLWRMLKE